MTAPTLAEDDEPYVSDSEKSLQALSERRAHDHAVRLEIDAIRAERRNRLNDN